MSYKSYFIPAPGKDIQCRELDLVTAISELPPKGVLVKVHTAGVCHTDLHILEGGFQLSEAEFFSYADRPGYGYPKVPGHEISGTVYMLGRSLMEEDCSLKVGDRVCVYPWIGCDNCVQCTEESNEYCTGSTSTEIGFNISGGYSEYVTVPDSRYVLPIPPGMGMKLASLVGCSCLTCYNAVKKSLFALPGETLRDCKELRIAIIGLGGVGLWALGLLPVMSPIDVSITGIDVNDAKLDQLLKSGLIQKSFRLSTSESVEEQAEEWLKTAQSGYHVIIDFVNNPQTFELGFRLLIKGGVMVAVGLFGGSGSVPLPLLALQRKTIIGIQTGSVKLMKEVLEFLGSNIDKVKYPELTVYKLSDCMRALRDMKERKITGRAVMQVEED